MSDEKKWHVCYTKSRAEKAAVKELELMGIEAYLPLQRKLRQWSDRKKWVETPLISGYLFVNITLKEYDQVLKVNSIVTYLRFEGKAAIIPECQIDQIKKLLRGAEEIEVGKGFKKGDKVEVITGPFMGVKGNLIEIKGKKRVVVYLDQIDMNFAVTIDSKDVTKIT